MRTEFFEEFRQSLTSWEDSIRDPNVCQVKVLASLLEDYAKTEYGQRLGAEEVDSIEEYRNRFPTITYNAIRPYLEEVQHGNYKAFLSEEPSSWVLTRGSTGEPKILPVTGRHLREIFECGSRAVVNFAVRSGDPSMLEGRVLNLNFPSNVKVLDQAGKRLVYGYSSGTYARLNPMFRGLALIPRQEEIDALRTGLSPRDWERRFELIYQRAKDEQVVSIIGVAPVQVSFGRYLKRRHGIYPKALWRLKAIFSTSVAKIQAKYAQILKSLYGEASVVEMYTATEGAFAQQRDSLPYIVPNYDTYLFEVKTGRGMKMLYELERGEWGRLIVSTSMLPRYDMGDMIEGMGKNYFRVFGRANRRTIFEHVLYRVLFRWFL